MNSSQEQGQQQSEELIRVGESFDNEADELIDKFFSEKGIRIDVADAAEKRLIIKGLALANKHAEIVAKINNSRRSSGLPEVSKNFDLSYYSREYSALIEELSIHYAQNLAKMFRFANRIVRVAKLSEIAEGVLDRIRTREEAAAEHKLAAREEVAHNANIKLFKELMTAVDDQMGKLRITKIDVGVKASDAPVVVATQDVEAIVKQSLQRFAGQLPDSIDANFTPITDYDKCEFAENFNNIAHCWYFNEQCKVQTGDLKSCPHFINRVVLRNREYMMRRWNRDKLSTRQIAEIAGCKEVDGKVIERVRNRLKEHGIHDRAAQGNNEGGVE